VPVSGLCLQHHCQPASRLLEVFTLQDLRPGLKIQQHQAAQPQAQDTNNRVSHFSPVLMRTSCCRLTDPSGPICQHQDHLQSCALQLLVRQTHTQSGNLGMVYSINTTTADAI
jgi:hypothetical protein